MKRTKLCAVGLIVAVLLQLCCGCDSQAPLLYFELRQKPATVDPQTAETPEERTLAENLFEGLLCQTDDGEIVCGAAENYTANGLTYTFTLRKNAHWESGERLIADDFVFGIQRAMDPATGCPGAKRLAVISDISAPDDRTVVITLNGESPTFLQMLCSPACMPCNRAFFESCVGKYGLERKYIHCNGAYYLARWNREDFGMRIYKNAEYHGPVKAKNGGVFFSCNTVKKSALQKLFDNEIDMTYLPLSQVESATEKGFATADLQNICWVLAIGDSFCQKYGYALESTLYSESLVQHMPVGYFPADSFCPPSVNFDGVLTLPTYDLAGAKSAFAAAVDAEKDKKFPACRLFYADTEGGKDLAVTLAAHWQQSLSAFVNVEAASNETLATPAGRNNLDLALFCVTADDAFAGHYLDCLSDSTADDETRQRELLEKGLFPVAFQTTAIAYSDALSGVRTEANGSIRFARIMKKD